MIDAGTRLGPYEILSPLGAGGMGEVYRARDTRLERTVAVKVLPAHLSSSPEVRQRFEREAKTISQLSHPHICALYDVGNQDGVEYLVMEYLEGETLADRLVGGPLPLEQTLRYGNEIADALDKAHRQGIVHRDLKPGNVMLTKSGVKLLDFGLARAIEPASPPTALSALPTQQKPLTVEGAILGTLQYMAPEQLEGKEADARTDIFALGATLFEMATGRKPFAGSTQASLIGAILHTDPPPISTLEQMSPPALDRVVRTCLAKDPEDRWQSAGDIGKALAWIGEGSAPGVAGSVAVPPARRSRNRIAWTVAAVALVAGGAAVFAVLRHHATGARLVRATLEIPGGDFGSLALSPDGSRLAFVAPGEEGVMLWMRPLSSLESTPIPGTEGATQPFWSPDGRFLAFFSGGKLAKIAAAGGVPQVLCDAPSPRGGAWSPAGWILFAPDYVGGLFRVPAEGGKPEPVTSLEKGRHEMSHRWPRILPDGHHFLAVVLSSDEASGHLSSLVAGSVDAPGLQVVLPDASNGVYVPPGLLLYSQEGNLLARRFDPAACRTAGESVAVSRQRVAFHKRWGYAEFTASSDGVLVYRPPFIVRSEIIWLDRRGTAVGRVGQADYYRDVRLSPDGRQIACVRADPETTDGDLWLLDAQRGTESRLTFRPAFYGNPVWSGDGRSIYFDSDRDGVEDIFRKSVAGGDERVVLRSPLWKNLNDASADGRFLTFMNQAPGTGADLWALPLFGDEKPFPILITRFAEQGGTFSPDGRWIAYVSNETGRDEVYVRPFQSGTSKWQVSATGGERPRWGRDGKELFFVSADGQLMAASVKAGATFEPGDVRALFRTDGILSIDVAADGQRFLAVKVLEGQKHPGLALVTDWRSELEKP